jgi:hypothetical protein
MVRSTSSSSTGAYEFGMVSTGLLLLGITGKQIHDAKHAEREQGSNHNLNPAGGFGVQQTLATSSKSASYTPTACRKSKLFSSFGDIYLRKSAR